MNNIKSKASKSLFWRSVEKFLVNGSQFVISLVLARLLLPSDYGTIALLTIFIALSQVLIEGGFSQVIIQKQDRDSLSFSTMFCCNIFTALLLYLIIYIIAPNIASFYNLPELTSVMRIYCITLVINSLYIVKKTQLIMDLKFKVQAYITFISVAISGIFGIILAVYNYGVWALVFQQICNSILLCLLFNRFDMSLYSFHFSAEKFRNLFMKGSRLLVANILQSVYSSLYSLIIGKFFSPKELGLFTRGNQMGQIVPSNVTDIFSNTMYPIFCQERQTEDFKQIYTRYIGLVCFVFFPCMVLLSTISFPLIDILLGDNWLNCASYMKILCIAYMFDPLMRLNAMIPTIMGETTTTLKCEMVKKVVAVTILVVATSHSVLVVCYGIVLYSLIDIIISTKFNKIYMGITICGIFLSIKNALIVSIIQFAVISFVVSEINNPFLSILVAVILSLIIVLLTAVLLRFKELGFLVNFVRNKILRKTC